MALILTIYTIVILWTAGLPDWIVAYATGLAQLGVWVTLLSLVPFGAVWVSLKHSSFVEMPTATCRAHWGVDLKVSNFKLTAP